MRKTAVTLLVAALLTRLGLGWVPVEVRERWKNEGYDMQQAIKTIEDLVPDRPEKNNELFYAVRYIDRNAHIFFKDTKMDLYNASKGSWELLMGYEDSRTDEYFLPYPDFRDFAMAYIIIEDNYFGKGIAKDVGFSFVAMGGPSKFSERRRQVFMDYQDFYINGQVVPDWDLSYFMRGYARNWYAIERKRPPLAFTLIAVTDKILVVRGSKTGGMAIFRRMKGDVRPAAYGPGDWIENIKSLWDWKG